MPYHHYRSPTLAGSMPRRHCATCGKESEVRDLAPYSPDHPAPKGVAAHYGLAVCAACRAKASGLDESPPAKHAERARLILGELANREAALLGEEPC